MTIEQKALEMARTPSKSDGMVKVIQIDNKDVYLKKKFDKKKKILFWSVAKIENILI